MAEKIHPFATASASPSLYNLIDLFLQQHGTEAGTAQFKSWLAHNYPERRFKRESIRTAMSVRKRRLREYQEMTQEHPPGPAATTTVTVRSQDVSESGNSVPALSTTTLTVAELRQVKELIPDVAQLDTLQQQVTTVSHMAEQVGGLDRLRAAVAALVELRR